MIDSTEYKLNYRVSGNGYPVVFLHGFLESSSMWDALQFPKEIQRIVFDLPGHGDSSSAFPVELSMENIAKYLRLELRKMGVENYALVGHSLGGYIGVELMKMDERMDRIIFLNSNFWGDNAQKIIDRERIAKIVLRNKTSFIYEAIPHLFLDPTKFHDEVVELINEAKGISAKTIADYSIAMSKRHSNVRFIRENAEKVLVIQGEEDAIVSVDRMNEYANKIDFNYQKLSPCGHMSHVEMKKEVGKLIISFGIPS